ncbi:DUF7455 domain-containing protein [Actinomyces faecalis]|uniref:DUF7455 domain-containing protein n=1 Tax=Actinomyces faecalis TaxID=2722820 RepID=UPI001C13294E|nr:hypothetical protein [Actinomyces faecalis]
MSQTRTPSLTPTLMASEAEAAPTPSQTNERPLTTADRCDVCGAQAFIRVVLVSGELLFCGHHGHAHMSALEKQALFIQDETSQLVTGA